MCGVSNKHCLLTFFIFIFYFQPNEGESLEYELFSVVIHSGGAHGGHYHAYIRDIDQLGTWVAPVSTIKLIK